jgi:hypothetical protein
MSGRERTARNSAELPFPAQFQISLLRHRLRPRQADDHQPYLRLRVGDEGQSIIVVSTGISITCLSFRCLRSLIGNVRPDGIRVCRQECRNYDTTGGSITTWLAARCTYFGHVGRLMTVVARNNQILIVVQSLRLVRQHCE